MPAADAVHLAFKRRTACSWCRTPLRERLWGEIEMRHLLLLGSLGLGLAAAGLSILPAVAAPAETRAVSKLYDGPGFDYPVIATYKAHVRFDTVWCKTHEGWCLVERNGQKGWLLFDGLDTEIAAADSSGGVGNPDGSPADGKPGTPPAVDRSAPGSGGGNFTKSEPLSAVDKIAPAPKTRF